MTWWLLLLACWQARLGSVYGEIGALSALFMAGLAIGSRRNPGPHDFPLIFALSTALSLLVAFGAALWHTPIVTPILLLASGLLTGAAFPTLAVNMGSGNIRRGAGRAFAADELGAAIAAGIFASFAIPWLGIPASAGCLAIFQLALIPATAQLMPERT